MNRHAALAQELADFLAGNPDTCEEVMAWRFNVLDASVEVQVTSEHFLGNLMVRWPLKFTEKIGTLGNRHLFLRHGNLNFVTVIQASKIDASA